MVRSESNELTGAREQGPKTIIGKIYTVLTPDQGGVKLAKALEKLSIYSQVILAKSILCFWLFFYNASNAYKDSYNSFLRHKKYLPDMEEELEVKGICFYCVWKQNFFRGVKGGISDILNVFSHSKKSSKASA